MKLNKNTLRRLILEEIRLIRESNYKDVLGRIRDDIGPYGEDDIDDVSYAEYFRSLPPVHVEPNVAGGLTLLGKHALEAYQVMKAIRSHQGGYSQFSIDPASRSPVFHGSLKDLK